LIVVECPKRASDRKSEAGETYSYYAGFSLHFAEELLRYLPLQDDAIVMDPWNGAGTTTVAATRVGLRSVGFDLNPAMVVVAKARLLSPLTYPSVLPIWNKIKVEAAKHSSYNWVGRDPMRDWLTDGAVRSFRSLELAIRSHLVEGAVDLSNGTRDCEQLSDLAAFFYVALFRVARRLTSSFKTSNPTWLRRASCKTELVSVTDLRLSSMMTEEISRSLKSGDGRPSVDTSRGMESEISVCNSEAIFLANDSIDAVLTSPPYCTRIDYAVATAVELAVLGYTRETTFATLRDSLMGTTTVPKQAPKIGAELGESCNSLLQAISEHSSVASNTYYLKNHVRYFVSLHASLKEISRVLKPNGIATFVVQDSLYKEMHNDLPMIVEEMCSQVGLTQFQREDFSTGVSLSRINSRSRRYKPSGFTPTESVISFYKRT
jgi:DNA modification methylase